MLLRGFYRRGGKGDMFTPKLFDKAPRTHISLYVPKSYILNKVMLLELTVLITGTIG